MKNKNMIKRILLIVLLSFTFFIKDCHFGCSTAKKLEDRLSYNTFSSGFPMPYFDLKVYGKESVSENNKLFKVILSYPLFISIPINLISCIIFFWIFSRFEILDYGKSKILQNVLFILIFWLDFFLFISYYPDFLIVVGYWLYILPSSFFASAIKFVFGYKGEHLNSIATRVYFVFLTGLIYFLSVKLRDFIPSKKSQ